MGPRLVIIPTFDEKENIRDILEAVLELEPRFDMLVVDDGSPDGTADIVRDVIQQHPDRVHLLERKGKQGLGTAYIAGFRWALERDARFIFEMDADFSHDPKDLVRLYDACAEGGADMSVGSRYVQNGRVKDWAWHRILLSYMASIYVRMILGLGVRDTTAGFVCYTRKALDALDLDAIRCIGYAFQIEMKYRIKCKGFTIAEVPITFIDRQKGRSKMSMDIFNEAFLGVLGMRKRIR